MPGDEADPETVCFSEGSLFEYGSDEDVVANLAALHDGTPGDCFVVGSAVRDTELIRVMRQTSGMTFVVRDREVLAALVARGGWTVEQVEDGNPLYEIVRLRKR